MMRHRRPAKTHTPVDKGDLAFGIATRLDDPAYRRSANGRACMVCGSCEPGTVVLAHINLIENGAGRNRKADDCDSVWLCAEHHRDMDTDPDRCRWLVINLLLPARRRAYLKWRQKL
jgi:hypothetical protein